MRTAAASAAKRRASTSKRRATASKRHATASKHRATATRRRATAAERFAADGYYHAKGVLDPDTVAGLVADFDRIVAQITRTDEQSANARWIMDTTTAIDGGGTTIIHTHQVQKYAARMARMLFDDRILDVVGAILGPDIVLHHTKLFLKPAGRGAAFPQHQDHSYFPTINHSMLAANVILSRQDQDNGCLHVWPGTHRLGPLAHNRGDDTSFAERFPFSTSVPVVCEPGDLVLFHYLTVHGSLANRGTHPRKHVLLQLLDGNDRMTDASRHPDSALVLRGWNHLMDRQRANAG